jgi:hypothetical protein
MADAPENSIENQEIANTLAELADLVKPIAGEEKIGIDAFYYLLLLWASFHVYPLDPPPDTTGGKAKIIPLASGWNAFDYGDVLSASPGEHYGNYCTGRLIESAQEMIDILAKRGVKKVGILGHDIARRAAWIECVDQEINIINFEPTDFDQEVRYRIIQERNRAGKIRKKLSPTGQRPEIE